MAFTGCGGGSGDSSTQELRDHDKYTRVDLSIDANAATIEVSDDNQLNVTLYEVPEQILAFTEPPKRDVYSVSTKALLLWKKMFPKAPNALLSGTTRGGDGFSTVLEMDQPTYNQNAGTVTFTARLIGDSPMPPDLLSATNLMIDPTLWQWIEIIWDCASAIIDWVGAIIEEGLNPLEDLEAVSGSVDCVDAIEDADW